MPRFAAIGLDHRHVYDLTAGLLAAGAVCAGHDPQTSDARVLAGFRKRFPDVPAVERDRLLDDPSMDFIVLAAVPRDRARTGDRGDAARQGRDGRQAGRDDSAISLPRSRRRCGRPGGSGRSALGRLTSASVQAALGVVRSGELGRLVSADQPGAASAEPSAAAGVVLRSRGVWRDYHRYWRAFDRPVSGLRGCVRRRDRRQHHRMFRNGAAWFRGLRRGDPARRLDDRDDADGLVHA